ncbi:MAG: DUF2721 domain-containing protein [Piscirickettsiaceae bacterium]|jgi:hypothetical protein|nr:DUF2721 domain-containing protein [Piscirickettsiaceae bacterium]
MTLNITDPAIMFPGISLLFLAYTNRYLALANVIRTLNKNIKKQDDKNRIKQIQNLHLRVNLIKYMQAFGVLSFLFCVFSMLSLFWQQQGVGEICFIISLVAIVISLLISLVEILKSGQSLQIEIDRTKPREAWDK